MPIDAAIQFGAEQKPAEFFLEGPVPGGEELLLRTVARVRRQSARSARLRLALFASAVLAACAALTGTGVVVGHLMGGGHPVVAMAASTISATDPVTKAELVVTMTPTDTGTDLAATVTGLPAGTTCYLTVIGKDGTKVPDAGWNIPANQKPMMSTVWLSEDQIAAIQVITSTGQKLIAHTR